MAPEKVNDPRTNSSRRPFNCSLRIHPGLERIFSVGEGEVVCNLIGVCMPEIRECEIVSDLRIPGH